MTSASWTPGTRLGPYTLIARVGEGGMGDVWRARDTRVDRAVAIKRLKPEYAERFRTEAHAIAALNHPHICQLYDVGPDYLVMEYVEGRPLAGPLPVADALRLGGQIASALAAAHRKGIVHRDLKPGNVLIDEHGAKLLDFGLATFTRDPESESTVAVTHAGTIVGTLAYISPEQAEGRGADARSDVFAFGTVLYELLSGRRAFGGQTAAETISAVLNTEPQPLEVPAPLERLLRRCLAKRPLERFQTMEEVRSALDQLGAIRGDDRPSIAVLPFANMSPAGDDEYFSDGLAEEIINALAQIPGLKVIARTSAFAFKGQHVDIRRIADALDVTTILEGSVRKAGTRIRVTAQLIAARDGSHLWSQRYDRELQDVFEVQDDIASAIAQALQVKLVAAPRPHTPNLEAYEALLRGRHHWSSLTPESLEKSRACYEQAVALDPDYALAHCTLAEHFFALAANGNAPPHTTIPVARSGALRALAIDPATPDAHALLGLIATFYEYDWDRAADRFRAALAVHPVPPRIRWPHGLYLSTIGRTDEAIGELELALRDDPLHLLTRSHLAGVLHAAGRRDEALRHIERVLELDRSYGVGRWYEGVFHALDGHGAEALASAEAAYSLRPWDTMTAGLLAGAVATTDRERAASLLTRLDRMVGSAAGRAVYHLVRREDDRFVESMRAAIQERDGRVPVFLPYIRTMPGWHEVATMMNLERRGSTTTRWGGHPG